MDKAEKAGVVGPKKEVSLRQLLIRALRRSGFRKICKGEPSDYSVPAGIMSQNLLLCILTGLVFFYVFRLGWSFWFTILLTAVSLLVGAALIAAKGCSGPLFYLAYVVLWFGILVWLAIRGDFGGVLLCCVVPFLLVPGLQWLTRGVRLTAHVPFFVPLSLILVLLPLLTEDPWRLASDAGLRLIWLALISVLPLAVILLRRVLMAEYELVIREAAVKALERAVEPEAVVAFLDKMRDRNRELEIDRAAVARVVTQSFRSDRSVQLIDQAAAAAKKKYRWLSVRRFILLFSGVGVALWLLIYAIACVAVPPALASAWSTRPVRFATVDVIGWSLRLPGGPYVHVALLLAIVACVGFLGFALTEDQYAAAIRDAALMKPVEDYLLLAVPYLAICEAESTAGTHDRL